MTQRLSSLAFLVLEYDEAIAFFTSKLGFKLVEDTPIGSGKRWVRVAPEGDRGSALLLARAATKEQRAGVGRQGAGRVFLFLETDDFSGDYAAMKQRGVRFAEAPREEPYGTVAVFMDLYGNLWDLVEYHARNQGR